MTNKLSEKAFNQILLQIAVKKLLDSINMINSDAKSKIEKCIACTKEKYSYALSLQADCVPDSKRMIIQAQKRFESLNSLLTLSKLI
ncbi:spore protein [Prochlorococcus sp. AH-716-K03]|nr:spore protein [Prochlorococcus sp. AH-716-K03]